MKEVIYSHSTQPVHKTARQYDSHIICIGTVVTDRRQILALLRSFVFLFGFTQVRFNFIDDVSSLYEVG